MRRSVFAPALVCGPALAVMPAAARSGVPNRQLPAAQQPLGVPRAQTRDEQVFPRFRNWIGGVGDFGMDRTRVVRLCAQKTD
jgi:hypothetical protein